MEVYLASAAGLLSWCGKWRKIPTPLAHPTLLAACGADVALAIEVGTTLTAWPDVYPVPGAPASNNPGVTVVDNLDGTDTITLTLPMSPEAAIFARLVVAITPP